MKDIVTIDSVAIRTLEQAIRFYGVRPVVAALTEMCDARAHAAAENFNTVLAKQWAHWATELNAICGDCSLTDPGRE